MLSRLDDDANDIDSSVASFFSLIVYVKRLIDFTHMCSFKRLHMYV